MVAYLAIIVTPSLALLALGLHLAPRAIGLDTGAVWGNKLTAIRLKDRTIYQENAR